jgi:hypothetical protein
MSSFVTLCSFISGHGSDDGLNPVYSFHYLIDSLFGWLVADG